LLNEDDVTKLVAVCENSRDRAFVLCVFETGGRITELLNIRRKHVQFDQYGIMTGTDDDSPRWKSGSKSHDYVMNGTSVSYRLFCQVRH
jgi:integrase